MSNYFFSRAEKTVVSAFSLVTIMSNPRLCACLEIHLQLRISCQAAVTNFLPSLSGGMSSSSSSFLALLFSLLVGLKLTSVSARSGDGVVSTKGNCSRTPWPRRCCRRTTAALRR